MKKNLFLALLCCSALSSQVVNGSLEEKLNTISDKLDRVLENQNKLDFVLDNQKKLDLVLDNQQEVLRNQDKLDLLVERCGK